MPRLPLRYTLFLFLLLLALLSLAHAKRPANVQESLKRIRHGPVLPTPVVQHGDPRDYDLQRRRADGSLDGRNGRNGRNGGSHDNHQPLGLDPQKSGHDADVAAAAGDGGAAGVGRRDACVPEYTPVVTPAPDQDAVLASQGYKQLTFYTCNTVGGKEHCGWHVPVVKAQSQAQAQGARRDSGTVWVVVGCLAGVFALGLM